MSRKEQDQYFEDNPGSRKKRKSGAGKTVLIILLFMLLIGACGIYLINHYLDRIKRIDPSAQTTLSPSEAKELIDKETQNGADPSAAPSESAGRTRDVTVDPNETYMVEIDGETRVVSGAEINENPDYEVIGQFDWVKAEPLNDDDLINIMLLGIDARKKGQVSRTDTMILVSINPRSHKISMVSFMRDLYLPIHDGYEDSRLNHAYEIGGLEFLYDCLKNNFGLHIDGSVIVDFNQFAKIVDILGGVDVQLTAQEAEHLKTNVIDYTGNTSTDASSLHEGVNHLDGNTALAYCRIRKIDDDYHRTARQRTVITALFNKIKTADVQKLNELLNTVLEMSTTDLGNSDIWTYAAKVLPYIGSSELSSYRIPCDGSSRGVYIRGMSVVQAVQQTNISYLQSVLPF